MANQQEPNRKVEAAAAAFDTTKAATTSRGNTVTVACKLPNGMRLRLFKMVPRSELVMGGGTRSFEIAEQIGESVVLNGYVKPMGVAPDHPMSGGYALTEGVNAEFMDEWLRQNQDLDAVKNNLIIVHEKRDMVMGQAKEQKLVRNGLEPLDPETKRGGKFVDNRVPRNVDKMDQKEPA